MARPLSRRSFLKGAGLAGTAVRIGLPPLEAMFNPNGTAYAATSQPIESRFVFWFNGNGIPEKYWIPRETGANFEFTPCLQPARTVPRRHSRHHRTRHPPPPAARSRATRTILR